MELFRIFSEFFGFFWIFSDFFGIFRNVLEFFQISDWNSGMLGSNVWNFMECSGIFGNVGVECFGILWNVLECSGMKPYVLACFGHFMEDTELWGNH